MAYYLLQQVIVATHGKESKLAQALGRDIKGLSSLGLYALAIGLAFWYAPLSWTIYALVAVIWLIPDRRIERVLQGHSD